jgi:two-component system sensor histidine kinase SenX3
MRKGQLPLGVIVPAALVVLVGTLATLQYRWLGQVGEAEREEMRVSLERRVREFSEDFDREVTRAYNTFRSIDAAVTPAVPQALASAFEVWRTSAAYPDLVKHVYFATEEGATSSLLQSSPDGRQFESVDWPASLDIVRARLTPEVTRMETATAPIAARGQVFAFSSSAVVPEIPALLIAMAPVVGQTSAAAAAHAPTSIGAFANVMVSLGFKRSHVIVELDRRVITDVILPTLADRHFASDRFRVSVVDSESMPLLTRGLAAGATITPDEADVSAALLRIRSELTADSGNLVFSRSTLPPMPATAGRGGSKTATGQYSVIVTERTATMARGTNLRSAAAGWQVRLQHAAGSLDAAVNQARRRNLWLSFGILSVLVASMGLLVFNARRSERLAEQQMDFVATVSHELRTPLAVIRSAAQNLSAGVVPDPAQARRYGDLIETEGRRLTDMVEQVLEYAGLSGNRRPIAARPVDVGGIVRDVLASSTPLLATEDFHVAVELQSSVPLVLADEDALRRALHNLVANALKYGADGRWLGVTVESAVHRGQPTVEISVSDKGRGIEAGDLPHIFETFYRGRYAIDRQIHGNGLGLSLVKRIAEAHGGRITVKSVPGEGSTFTLHLPALIADPGLESVPAPASGGGRIA